MTRAIGIDFGTSTTVVKIQNDSANPASPVESITFNGHPTVPTMVFCRAPEDDGAPSMTYFGYEAEAMNRNGMPGVLSVNFKMDLVSTDEQRSTEARRLTQLFFNFLHEAYLMQASTFGPCDKVMTYVSYPAKWPSDVRVFMKECAINAGFGTADTVQGVDEPTAAVLASISDNLSSLQQQSIVLPDKPMQVMMIDMGAGTSDIALFKMSIPAGTSSRPSIYDVVTYPSIECSYLCGGREIDATLADYVVNYITSIRKPPFLTKGREQKTRDTINQWKDTIVSPQLASGFKITTHPVLVGYREELIDEGIDVAPESEIGPFCINRVFFEYLTRNHWTAWRNLLNDALQEACKCGYEMTAADIDLIILAGGHSQWYGTRDFLLGEEFAGLEPLGFTKIEREPIRLMQSQRPHETVAKGLCLYDTEFDVKQVTANNVWIRFQMGNVITDWQKAIDKNVTLPCTAPKLVFEIETTANLFVREQGAVIVCETAQGESLENCRTHKEEVLFPPQGAINHFFDIIFGSLLSPLAIIAYLIDGKESAGIKKAFETPRKFKLSPDITVGADGIIRVSGSINADGKTIKLTEHQI